MMQTRREFTFKAAGKFLGLAPLFALALVSAPAASAQVLTVPWDPTNPAAPHTSYAINGTTEATIVLGATFLPPTSDVYKFSWTFGDSTSTAPAVVSNPNDISATHQYPATAAVGTNWTATVQVVDQTTNATFSGTYLVQQEANTLQTRVNVAIDLGLWFLHQSMYHGSSTTGTWESCAPGYGYACGGYGSLTATNVQAFEVDGHLANGPATDPYTSDVAEGLASLAAHFVVLDDHPSVTKTYTYNPAATNFGCSNGTSPVVATTPALACPGSTPVFYNASAASCTTPGSPTLGNCIFHFDGNGNNQMAYVNGSGDYGYEMGMYVDALVASGNLAATFTSGALAGETYKDVVQDLIDYSEYCQYTSDSDVLSNQTRGANNNQGGGWWYGCPNNGDYGDDNSTSQWQSIGLIAATRGFGLSLPPVITDANNMWVTASQDVQATLPPAKGSWLGEYYYTYNYGNQNGYGGFGYNGSLYYSDAWGPFAVTPSGMVQMSLDGIGRTINNAAGDGGTNAADQRFNNAETFYADNFCNAVNNYGGYNPYNAPRSYVYGMFSFTKSMLLHNPNGPGGALSQITYLRTQTPGVFTSTNPNTPANTIDWYGAIGPEDGGTDSCDGIAQTLLDRQQPSGVWNGSLNYPVDANGDQYPYETAWSLIMLQRTVFVNCVNNLAGVGTANSGLNPARIDLSWTGIPSATGYNVLRSTTSGSGFVQVGTTSTTLYSDRTGLSNGGKYYYELEPTNGGGAVCTSNQATVTVPVPRR